ncbi:MAG: 50S ribosomal protein L6 [Mollicutes bacterium]|nr:MAG: 50S ribosomal protein L6 [Mollicutes bacterium]
MTKGFSKKLIINGLGYKAILKGNILELHLGFSHPINYSLSDDITAEVKNNTIVTISGIDKQKVGLVASQIRKFKKTEPYKGKGVRYENEVVLRKIGKTASSTK